MDFQQCFQAGDPDERPALQEHLESIPYPDDPAWSRLRRLCRSWIDPGSVLFDSVTEVWLEFDARRPLIPSLFVALRQQSSADETWCVMQAALTSLADGCPPSPMLDNLRRCVDSCTDGVRVSCLGAMLSRDLGALRVNISGMTADRLATYLNEVGYPRATARIRAGFESWMRFVDRIVLCLDVGPGISPRLGLECSLAGQPNSEPRWSLLLQELVDRGLCTPVKRDALLAWPGRTDPTSGVAPWPAYLIAESLLRGPEWFSMVSRGLSHVKVVYPLHDPIQAKAYWGFRHSGRRVDVDRIRRGLEGRRVEPAGNIPTKQRRAGRPAGDRLSVAAEDAPGPTAECQ